MKAAARGVRSMTTGSEIETATTPKPLFSSGYKSAVLSLLVLAYTFNFIDRTIVATIGQAIKVDLKITDTQLGLLGGLSFAVLYTVLGIPIARFAERFNRVSIISLAMVVWSGFTMACGFAGSFAQLLALRVGVGVGEAGCSPPSHSLISDYYEPKRRASALSVYAFGIPLGSMIGAVAGGWLAKTFGWRVAFIAVGAPGLLMALLLKVVVKEPPRGYSDPAERPAAATPFSFKNELSELGAVAGTLFLRWPIFNMVMGVTLVSFAGYGIGQFAPPYFNRAFGLDYAVVGLIFGLVGGFSAGVGTLAGGFLSDRASRWGGAWYALVPAIGVAIAAPLYFLAYTQTDWRVAAAILLLPGIFGYTYLGPTFAVVQNVVETRRRATATAVLFLFLNIIALGGGTLFTGWVSDLMAQNIFHGGNFTAACPGGAAPHGAAADLAVRCKAALVGGTRRGILITTIFYVWGSLHYLLASFGLAKELSRVAADRKLREA
jgi:MFS family permease